MANATIRALRGSNNAGLAAIALNAPAGVAVGDWLVAVIVDTLATSGTSVTPPSGWTAAPNVNHVVMGTRNFEVYYHRYTQAEATAGTTSWTWTQSANSSAAGVLICGPAGLDPASWVWGTYQRGSTGSAGTTYVSSTSQTTPGITSSLAAGTLVLSLQGEASSATETDAQVTVATAGWTKNLWYITSQSGPVNSVLIASKTMSAAGTPGDLVSSWQNATANRGSIMVAIPPSVDTAAVTISYPTAGSTIANATPTYTGTGEPGASVVVKNAAGTALGTTATVASDGTWSYPTTVAQTNGSATYTATQTTTGGTVTTASVTYTYTAAVTHLAGRIVDSNAAVVPGMWQLYDGSALVELASMQLVPIGRRVPRLFASGYIPKIAHRCGSLDYAEMSMRGATQSVLLGYDALEFSVARTSDGVYFGLHDATLNRTSPSAPASYDPAAHTWAEVQAYQVSVGNGDTAFGAQPYQTLNDLVAAYGKTHVIFVDPKVIGSAYQDEFFTLLTTFPDYRNTFVAKYFHTGTGVADRARAKGIKSWGYAYTSDIDGTSGGTQLSATAAKWDYLGMEYTATQDIWNQTLAIAAGKPVIGHITPTLAAAQQAVTRGAAGVMVSGVRAVAAGPDLRLLATDPFTTAGALSTTTWAQHLNDGTATVDGTGHMTLTPRGTGYVVSDVTLNGSQAADSAILGSFKLTTAEQYTAISLRAPLAPVGYYPNGYSLNIWPAQSGAELRLTSGRPDGGYQVDLLQAHLALVSGAEYRFRFTVVGNLLRAKVWLATAEEPAEWTMQTPGDGQWTSGYANLQQNSAQTNPPAVFGAITVQRSGAPTPAFVDAPAADSVTRNGTTRTLSYWNDFTVPAALGKVRQVYSGMGYYDGFTDTSGQGLYAPDRVLSVHDSVLDFYLHLENGQPLVAAVMPDNYTGRTSGRVDLRYKTTGAVGSGFKFVGMQWPVSDNWNQGEIDWPEADLLGTPRPANAVPGSLVTDGQGNSSMTFVPSTEYPAFSDSSGWHTASYEWGPGGEWFYWDDVLVATIAAGASIPTAPMRTTLQGETWIGEGQVPPASAGGHVLIDWIAIWV